MSQIAFPTTEQLAASAFKLLAENPLFKLGEATIRGNTYRVFENAPPSLVGVFLQGSTYGDKDFLYYEGETWSHAKLWSEACRMANALSAGLGVKKGDKVAIAMRNYPEWCAAYMAIISLGAVAVPLNAWWKGEELRYALKDSGARIAFVDDKRCQFIRPFKDELGLTLISVRADSCEADLKYADLLAKSHSETAPSVDINPDDDFAIYYTSGSTGNPKGVILTHRGAISTLFSWSFIAMAIKDARGGVSLFGDNPGILLGIPLFHVTGSHAIFLLSCEARGRSYQSLRIDEFRRRAEPVFRTDRCSGFNADANACRYRIRRRETPAGASEKAQGKIFQRQSFIWIRIDGNECGWLRYFARRLSKAPGFDGARSAAGH